MTDGGEIDYVAIEPAPVATRAKRRRRQFGLLAFLMFTCFAGATLGIVGRQWLQERRLDSIEQADLAAFQGAWDVVPPSPTGAQRPFLIVTGADFQLPNGHGKIRIDVTTWSKTVDFEGHPFEAGPAFHMTCHYAFEEDRLTLRLVGKSLPDGSYAALNASPSEIVLVREPSWEPKCDQD